MRWNSRYLGRLALILGCWLLGAAATVAAQQITCDSYDNRTQYCPADTRGGVRLVRQHSKAPCQEGASWGYDHRGIWVARGCRATFVTEDRGYGPGPGWDRGGYEDRGGYGDRRGDGPPDWHHRGPRRVQCESWDGRQNFCRAPVGNGRVFLEQQLSDASCRQGRTWGYNPNGIWVTGGCRGLFGID